MSEDKEEAPSEQSWEKAPEGDGGDTQSKGADDHGCADDEVDPSESDDYWESPGDTLAGDPTKLGKP